MQGGNPPTHDGALSIDTKWLIDANDEASQSLARRPPASPTIFRVPPSLSSGKNQHDYKPKLVSIGPYHHGSENLKDMEELKRRMLHHYLSMVPNGRNNERLRMMKTDERKARDCYSEVIDMDSDQFMKMLLLDGSFLVQIFITLDGTRREAPEELKSLLSNNEWFKGLIIQDMLLLENQLPYFIVQHLLNIVPELNSANLNLPYLALCIFRNFLSRSSNVPYPPQHGEGFQDADHLLDLFHRWILSIPRTEASETRCCHKRRPFELLSSFVSLMLNRTGNSSHSNEHPVAVPTMTELVEAGVKIEVRKADSFLGIAFSKDEGVLKIPDICVSDHTSFLFANLIAFEQCCKSKTNNMYITHYAMFLDDIINTPKDVELLHQHRIIHRCLGSDEDIASLFNGLGNGVVFHKDEKNYLHKVYKDLDAYCQAKWPRFRAKAMHYYFNSPWAFMSSVAAALLIVLTLLQTVYTIIGYYKKSDQL